LRERSIVITQTAAGWSIAFGEKDPAARFSPPDRRDLAEIIRELIARGLYRKRGR
jgi:hypothetical protein